MSLTYDEIKAAFNHLLFDYDKSSLLGITVQIGKPFQLGIVYFFSSSASEDNLEDYRLLTTELLAQLSDPIHLIKEDYFVVNSLPDPVDANIGIWVYFSIS
jgi:hypothetical protein